MLGPISLSDSSGSSASESESEDSDVVVDEGASAGATTVEPDLNEMD
jgi:hypothetical protein